MGIMEKSMKTTTMGNIGFKDVVGVKPNLQTLGLLSVVWLWPATHVHKNK